MKLNQLIVLGATAALVTTIPISSRAITIHSAFRSMAHPIEIAQAQSVALSTGTFVAAEKPTMGTARIVSEVGHKYLELDSAFSTSDQGPDLHVLLETSARPPRSYTNLGSAVNLGKLSKYSGAQRYPIPDAINVSNFNSVVIWCRMANATFGYAPLQPPSNARVQ